MISVRRTLALSLCAFALSACPKPPPPPPPPAEKPVEAPPPPPPCEKLDEKCEAKSNTSARIGKSGMTASPPAGWVYAQMPDHLVAQSTAAAVAVLVTDAFPDKKKKKELKDAQNALITSLAEKVGVTFPKLEKKWKKQKKEGLAVPTWPRKAQGTKEVGEVKFALYQFDGAMRGEKKGPMLVFTAPVDDGHIVAGAGFVAADDDSDADGAILTMIESIKKGASEAKADDDGDAGAGDDDTSNADGGGK